jgi:antitoxin HigA-1
MSERLKPVHPGEILQEEFLKPLNLSMNALALDLHVPVTRIADIVHERRAVTPETALRLAKYFGTTPEFWVNLQARFDLESAKDRDEARVSREVRPLAAHSAGSR